MPEYCAIISLANDSDGARNTKVSRLDECGWRPEPRGRDIWSLRRAFSDDGEALEAAGEISEIVGRQWAPDDDLAAHAAARLEGDVRYLNTSVAYLLASGDVFKTVPGMVDNVLNGGRPKQSSESGNGKGPATNETKVAEPASPAAALSTGQAPDKTIDSRIDPATLLTTGLSALTVPDSLWKHLPKDEAASIAATVILALYAKLLACPDHLSWLTAPEMVLLDRAPVNHQANLAEQMLRVRAGIAPHQTRLAHAEADYADKRTAVASKVVQLLDDTHQHLQSRKRLAAWGPWMLLGTTIFAGLALAAVLVFLGIGKVDGWGAAVLVFVLALFAISPAVLLINEQPLQGLDKWMPGGSAAADDTSGKSEAEPKKDEPADKPAAKAEAK